MKNYIVIILIFCISTTLLSQQNHSCQTKTDDNSLSQIEQFSNYYYHQNGKFKKNGTTRKVVSITLHLVSDDDESRRLSINRAFKLVCELNELMDTANLFFFVNDVKFIKNSTWNADATNHYSDFSNLKEDNTINVFLVGNTSSADLCGVYVGTAVNQGNAGGRDIIAVSATCANASTLSHEIGHFLSLPHTFYGWENRGTAGSTGNAPNFAERVDNSNCSTAGDKICDTPPDYLYARWSNGNCAASGTVSLVIDDANASVELTDPNGVEFTVDGTNIMSYSSNDCMTYFSEDQIEAMHFNLETYRSSYILENIDETPIQETISVISPLATDTVPFNEATLSWNPVLGATHYLVQVNYVPSFATGLMVAEEITTSTSIDIFNLEPNRTFRWRVIPYHGAHTCENAFVKSFFVGDFSVGENEYAIDEIAKLNLYPNPTEINRKLTLKIYAKEALDIDFTILNSIGQVVQNGQMNLTKGNNFIKIQHGSLGKGIFILAIRKEQQMIIERFVVQ
jgi:hypothetical protein